MSGLSALLETGKSALVANQVGLQVTGNNIANVDTEGYSRRSVVYSESTTITTSYGQIGTGVTVSEITRSFDEYVESAYNDKSTVAAKYEQLLASLTGSESLFNESNTSGISTSLSNYFTSWQDLSLSPNSQSTRAALISSSQTLTSLLNTTASSLQSLKASAETSAAQEVEEANQIIQQIASLNGKISSATDSSSLLDQRAALVRELAEKIDCKVVSSDQSDGSDWALVTDAGQTLVHGSNYFELKYEGPKVMTTLSTGSTFDGTLNFSGSSSYEYTVEVVQAGDVSSGASAALFRVSLDGGETWLTDSDGNELHYAARPDGESVTVGELEISFSDATEPLSAGDTFNVVPKNGIYWYKNTSTCENITPQLNANGTDDTKRLTGGTIAALMSFAGDYVGSYTDQLDALSKSLIWETNRLHSQGMGTSAITDVTGTYAVKDANIPLGDSSSGLIWSDYLSSGNTTLYIYTTDTTAATSCAAYGALDFDTTASGVQSFNPAVHSLQDVSDALNNTFGTYLTATITNGVLNISSDTGYQLGFGEDTAGIWAGLGINTYFTGSSASDIAVNSTVVNNYSLIATASIDGDGEYNTGDNTTATAIADLVNASVTITATYSGSVTTTFTNYYSSLVSEVGGDTANAEYLYEYNQALADDLDAAQDAVSGVSLDEEMTNLIKFQNAYRAAAKLITAADEMLQIVIGLKQ
jgi:flagellar hook-associated protein 1 FlgK